MSGAAGRLPADLGRASEIAAATGAPLNASGVRRNEPEEDVADRRLAAAAGANDGDDLARPHFDVEIPEQDMSAERFGEAAPRKHDVADQRGDPGSASQKLPSLLSVLLDMIWEPLIGRGHWGIGPTEKKCDEMNDLGRKFAIAPMMDWTDIAKSNVYSAT